MLAALTGCAGGIYGIGGGAVLAREDMTVPGHIIGAGHGRLSSGKAAGAA